MPKSRCEKPMKKPLQKPMNNQGTPMMQTDDTALQKQTT
jgi:hypothetical protein